MPHIIVKMYPGRTKEQKEQLAKGIFDAALKAISCPPDVISVAVEEISPDKWQEEVVIPLIEGKADTVVIKPKK